VSGAQEMRAALTLWPEWAYAVARLGKRVENRTWIQRPLKGKWLCIHGGKYIGGERGGGAGEVAEVLSVGGIRGYTRAELDAHLAAARACQGKIVAIAKVADFVKADPSPWFFGPWGWVLSDVQVLREPVAARGMSGVWSIQGELLQQVRDQLR